MKVFQRLWCWDAALAVTESILWYRQLSQQYRALEDAAHALEKLPEQSAFTEHCSKSSVSLYVKLWLCVLVS